MKCRHCKTNLKYTFVDLGSSPPSNSYISENNINNLEKWYPLKVMVCEKCWLVQTMDFVGAKEMFSDEYAYFSSFSETFLTHSKNYVKKMISKFNLSKESLVVEVAANDGYLLQYVKKEKIPCYGFEPTLSTAKSAKEKGIEIIEDFFDEHSASILANKKRQADLIVANNVLAHVPNINGFVKGFSVLLKETGVATFEFPHLVDLVQNNLFDTIYHEHYSYLSFTSVQSIFLANGLSIFDVEKIPTHGGSLRVYAHRSNSEPHPTTRSVYELADQEKKIGIDSLKYYQDFQKKVVKIKIELLDFLIQLKKESKKVIAYGAAAKGNTLLNFSGVDTDLITYVVDKNPAKQGKLMPGSRIPILSPDVINYEKPDYIIILPWNIKDEVISQLAYVKKFGCKFVTILPEINIINS